MIVIVGCECVYVCVCMCTSLCMCVCARVGRCVVCIFVCVSVHYFMYVCVYVCICVGRCIVHVFVCVSMCMCVQNTASWLGFASTVGCVVGGIGFGRLGDKITAVKPVLLLLFVASSIIFGWFTLIANHIIKQSTWQLFFSITLGRCV